MSYKVLLPMLIRTGCVGAFDFTPFSRLVGQGGLKVCLLCLLCLLGLPPTVSTSSGSTVGSARNLKGFPVGMRQKDLQAMEEGEEGGLNRSSGSINYTDQIRTNCCRIVASSAYTSQKRFKSWSIESIPRTLGSERLAPYMMENKRCRNGI